MDIGELAARDLSILRAIKHPGVVHDNILWVIRTGGVEVEDVEGWGDKGGNQVKLSLSYTQRSRYQQTVQQVP